MATRQRSSTGRTSKKAAPPLGGKSLEESAQQQNAATKDDVGADESTAEVTRTTLQRRELPSLSEDRQTRIAERAYWRAERRGFTPGNELEDWLEAEREIDTGK